MDGLHFKISAKSFYQTNPKQAQTLYACALQMASLKGDELVYDLYTGTGTIAQYFARHCKHVIGIEYIEDAIRDAQYNAVNNNLQNTTFIAGDLAATFTKEFVARHGKPQVIITDPPRAGMHPDVVSQINQLRAEKVIYISCNPATQARDLILLQEVYSVEAIQPVDMFPQTTHVENIVLLIRKD
jgi:23S rRNA (uracil1939-C5)-methyltransferase